LIISNLQARREPRNLSIGEYDFEGVRGFSYFGTNINSENKVNEDIQKRIMAGNRAYFAFIKLFRPKLKSKGTKMKLYKALVRPVVTYGAQAWTLRSVDEQALRVFERKVLRLIYGSVCIQGEQRLRTNAELDHLLGHADSQIY
jgi:hypothetical protein